MLQFKMHPQSQLNAGGIDSFNLPYLSIAAMGYPFYFTFYVFFGTASIPKNQQDLYLFVFALGILTAITTLQTHRFQKSLMLAIGISLASFAGYLLVPVQLISTLAIVIIAIFSANVVVYAFFACVFVLNHRERFIACGLIVVVTYIMLQAQQVIPKAFLAVASGTAVTIMGLLLLLSVKVLDPEQAGSITPESAKPVPRIVYLLLIFVLFIYIIDIAFVGVLREKMQISVVQEVLGVLWLIVGLFMVTAALAFFRESIWIIWGIYFLMTMMAMLVAILTAEGYLKINWLFRVFIDLSIPAKYFLIWYVSGIFCKKYRNVMIVRVAFALSCIGILIGVGLSILMKPLGMEVISFSALVLCFILVLLFTICTPVFYRLFSLQDPQENQSAPISADEVILTGLEEEPELVTAPSFHLEANEPLHLSLTPQEQRLYQHLIEGYTLRQISGLMHIKYNTVVFHYKNVYKKMGVNSRYELVLQSIQTKDVN